MENGRIPHNPSPPPTLMCRGVRGATTVAENSAEAILNATRELLYTIIRHNEIDPDDVASVYFTTTTDINATYPAVAARQLGWFDVPLLCGHEMEIPGSLAKCVRIMLHWNTHKAAQEIVHVYLREAKMLRPDKKSVPPIPPEEIELAMQLLQNKTK